MADIQHGHSGSSFAMILVLFILLAIIGCVCYQGGGGTHFGYGDFGCGC